MEATIARDETMQALIRWGEAREDVRAAILTSTRTNPNAHTDVFSDYDIIYFVRDVLPYYEERGWLDDFGPMLVAYRDPIQAHYDGLGSFAYITQYENGLKIDFVLMQVEALRRMAADTDLIEEMDVGYTVLLDKDDLAAGLKPPTYRAHIPAPPTEEAYLTRIEEFFHEATYLAKQLWRGELMPAKYFLEKAMKLDNLRIMLEWRVEIDAGWAYRPGVFGKGLKKRLPPTMWAALESTYVGPDEAENWQAMFRLIDLFRDVAVEVGRRLGYPYPHGLDRRVVAYLERVRTLDRKAETFPG